jgi:DNA polymerase III delta prime subunit
MNITTAIAEVKKAAAAGLPVLLLGSPGIGKTTVGYILAQELSLPYVEVRPAEFEAVDFRGIPTVENGRTRWNVPNFWPESACLLNVDEITQAPMELTSPLLKLFLGGAIGDYKLPEGTVLMATGNLVSDRAGCSRLSSALRERCIVITIEPDFAEWRGWYQEQSFADAGLLAFLESNPAMFSKWDAKQDFNQPTPRNWARLSRLLPYEPEQETVAGIIGPDAAASFCRWRRANVQLPSIDAILAGTASLPASPAMMSKLVELLPAVAKARWILQDDSVMRLVDGMDGTYQVQFLKAVAKQQPSLLKEKEFGKLVKRHAAAIVASR